MEQIPRPWWKAKTSLPLTFSSFAKEKFSFWEYAPLLLFLGMVKV
jgi:hypothetical protein